MQMRPGFGPNLAELYIFDRYRHKALGRMPEEIEELALANDTYQIFLKIRISAFRAHTPR